MAAPSRKSSFGGSGTTFSVGESWTRLLVFFFPGVEQEGVRDLVSRVVPGRDERDLATLLPAGRVLAMRDLFLLLLLTCVCVCACFCSFRFLSRCGVAPRTLSQTPSGRRGCALFLASRCAGPPSETFEECARSPTGKPAKRVALPFVVSNFGSHPNASAQLLSEPTIEKYTSYYLINTRASELYTKPTIVRPRPTFRVCLCLRLQVYGRRKSQTWACNRSH